MLDHPQPRCRVVMGTIDAHAIHAVLEKIVNESIINRRLGWHGDHDPDPALDGGGAQQAVGVLRK